MGYISHNHGHDGLNPRPLPVTSVRNEVISILRGAYKVLVGKPEGKRPPGRSRRRWEANIRMDLWERGWEGVYWIQLPQDRDK
jgi:hypothetical protein